MKIKFLVFCCVSIFFHSCANREKNNTFVDTVNIDVKQDKTLDLSRKLNIYNCVPLETTSESLIKQIEKIYVIDSSIVIFDNKQNEIFLFKSNGEFIRKFGSKGNGPGEHIMFNDVFYDYSSKLMYAQEGIKQFMYIYDISGKLISEIPTKQFMFRSFCKVEDGYWIYSCYKTGNPNGYSIMKVGNNFEKILCGYFPQKNFFRTSFRSTFLQNSSNENFFIYPFSNIVYKINDNDLSPFFEINFGRQTLPYSQIQKLYDEMQYDQLVQNNGYMGRICDFMFTGDEFHFNFSEIKKKSIQYHGCYNIKKKTIDVFKNILDYKSPTESQLNFKHLVLSYPVGVTKDMSIYIVKPYDMDDQDLLEINSVLKSTIDIDSNPILFFMKSVKG
ncbi:MAG: 6-bladed beta-propeller [Paludibacter sp.]|nr:6-bladed beta-propeller [Paludibacter sp.]